MRRKWRKAKPEIEKKKFVSGERIRSREVFLIDESGVQVGVISTQEALNRAKELELELILVNPKSDPPVAKIADLGQLKYEADKRAHKQKVQQKKTDTKELRLSVRISAHDLGFRLNQAEKFLAKDNKLKIELILKGRERQHPEKAREVIDGFVDKLRQKENLNIAEDQPLTKQGRRFTIVLMNKK